VFGLVKKGGDNGTKEASSYGRNGSYYTHNSKEDI